MTGDLAGAIGGSFGDLADAAARYGYWAVLLVVAGDGVFPALPGETAIVAAAVLAADGILSLPLVIAAGGRPGRPRPAPRRRPRPPVAPGDPRATVAAIAAVGARALVSTTVCGAVDASLDLGSLIVFDDLHFASNRMADGSLCTLFTGPEIGGRGHWIYERPFGEGVRAGALPGARAAGISVRDGGTYGHVDGPRLNTRSEIAQLAAAGVVAVSQTGGPETVLAGEARLPLALVGFVTDHANGVTAEPTPAETLARLFAESAGVFQGMLAQALPRIAEAPGDPAGIMFAL